MVATRHVAIAVAAGAAVVLNGDILDVHGEWGFAGINLSTGPLASTCSLWVGGIETSNPVTHLDLHWGLREVLASKSDRITVVEGSDEVIVDGPFDELRGPLDGVGVPGADGVSDCVSGRAIIGRGVALSEEVALNMAIVGTQPFPINLVEIVGLQDEGADNTSAWGSLYLRLDLAKEDVFRGADRWRIGLLINGELGAV